VFIWVSFLLSRLSISVWSPSLRHSHVLTVHPTGQVCFCDWPLCSLPCLPGPLFHARVSLFFQVSTGRRPC
jgi:hypothetical protein